MEVFFTSHGTLFILLFKTIMPDLEWKIPGLEDAQEESPSLNIHRYGNAQA